jgi:monoterpene epsilon-lactone hydrolase
MPLQLDVLALPADEVPLEAAILAEIAARNEQPPVDRRAGYDAMVARTALAPGVAFTPVDADGVRGVWARPAGAPSSRAILFLHGGGYTVGSAPAYRGLVSQIAARAGVAAFIADYPLAPEAPFPAAYDAARATWRWLGGQGITEVAFVGDSAGGGLVLALLGDPPAGAPRVTSVVAFSPWTDLALTGGTMRDPAQRDPIFGLALFEALAAGYLAGADPRDGRASPLHALPAVLPPLLIQVGSDERLLDDARRYAEAAGARGGEVRLDVYQGLHHIFQHESGTLPSARRALDDVGTFVARHF